MGRKQRSLGIILEDDRPTVEGMQYTRSLGFDYVCQKVVEPKRAQQLLEADSEYLQEPFTFCDLDLPSSDWSRSFVGVISDLRKELTGDNQKIKLKATKLLKQEMDYCKHLNCPVIMVEPDTTCVASVAELTSSKLAEFCNQGIWVRVPMLVDHQKVEKSFWPGAKATTDGGKISGWYIWTAFHAECSYAKTVCVAVELSEDIPDDEDVKRWLGEPVKCVIIPTSVFLTNAKGYPVLTKPHQQLLRKLLTMTFQIVIQPSGKINDDFKFYKQYVEHLTKQWDGEHSDDPWVDGYEDFLQSPLQPLMHNLESEVYEVFEKDPVKYVLYENAIAAAIISKQPEVTTEKLVVMVVGAGRGPIVRAAIKASQKTERPISLYALEKNRNAVNTLLHLKNTVWKAMGFDVTVVHSDMRKWQPTVRADVIVSELLGSFGDNELSPECLDGAQNFLKDDGVMIPTNYISYLQPIMSSKLHSSVNAIPEPRKTNVVDSPLYQTPYVVHMRNKFDIAEPKELFTFQHPKKEITASNDRNKELEFVVTADSVFSGFAGYFESELFGGIYMSILPSSYTENMFSWFPIYFPIKNQIPVKKGDVIRVRFRRCSSEKSVWYEWNITSPTYVSTHNLNGCAYEIGL